MMARSLVIGLNRAVTPSSVVLQAALIAGLVASFTHSVVDFVWYVPSLGMLAMVFAACAMRLEQMQPSDPTSDVALSASSRVALQWNSVWFPGAVAVTAAAFAVAVYWGPRRLTCLGPLPAGVQDGAVARGQFTDFRSGGG